MNETQWSSLPSGASRPAMTPGMRVARNAALASVAVLVLCGGLAAWMSLRPLVEPSIAMAEPPPVLEPVSIARQSIDERQRTLAAVSASNMFNAERSWWTPSGSMSATEQVAESGSEQERASPEDVLPEAGGTIAVVENEDDLPQDLQKAIKNIDLMGVYRQRDGEPVGMVRFVKDGGLRTQRATRGDTITSTRDENDSWLVLALEERPTSIILRRDGLNVRVPLREGVGGMVALRAANEASTPTADGDVRVEARTEADVRIELLLAGYSEEEIAELLALASGEDVEPAEPEAPAVVATTQQAAGALRDAIGSSDENASDAGASTEMPPGLAALFEMMASGETPSEEAFREIEERKRREAQGGQSEPDDQSLAPNGG